MVIKEFSPDRKVNFVKNKTILKNGWKQHTSRIKWTFKVLSNSSKVEIEKPLLSNAQIAMLEQIKVQIETDIQIKQNLSQVTKMMKPKSKASKINKNYCVFVDKLSS